MRVSQIQNLTWGGNVLVLAGLVWVGLQFWESTKSKPAKELAWEKAKSGADDPTKRWPGDVKDFAHIWSTPVSGKFPPPPEAAAKPQPKPDRVAAFKAKLTYVGGWETPSRPESSTARIKFDTKDLSITPGASLDGFQLIQFTLVERKDGARLGKLVFKHPETGLPVEIEQQAPQGAGLVDTGPPKAFVPQYGGAAQPGPIAENGPLDHTAFVDPKSGEWIVPVEEQLWIESFGEKKLWSALATKPDADAQGVSRGLRILSLPEANTPLAPSHGVGIGDVIRSINGVAVGSKEDIALYLRGPGKGLERYEVVVDTGGAPRTVVYRVPRPRRTPRDRTAPDR